MPAIEKKSVRVYIRRKRERDKQLSFSSRDRGQGLLVLALVEPLQSYFGRFGA
jgi:hypothetical protein